MKWRIVLIVMCCTLQMAFAAPLGIYQRGTIVRMRMGECLSGNSFMAAMSGNNMPAQGELCPEYTLVTDKVVYVIVGKMSNQLLPLAAITNFRFHKNELAVRVDDANHESKFRIKEMVLRPQWDREQQRVHEVEESGDEGSAGATVSARRRH
jgi:hypothetical protein